MSSKMELDGSSPKNLKRPRTPSSEEQEEEEEDQDRHESKKKTTSQLDLGLPECLLVSPSSKRSAATTTAGAFTSPSHNSDTPTRRITRHAATVAAAANDPALEGLHDPFEVLPDNIVRDVILLLPNRSIVALRRVSRFWKGNVEYVISQAVVERKFGHREVTERLKAENKLGWAEFAFRKNAFLDQARATGAPTSVKKFTNAQLWEHVGDRIVWIDDSSNLNVQHLSAWDVNERKDSLVALAGNPRALARNKFLHGVIASESRKAPAERPKRIWKKEKTPEAIVIRWSLRDTLKTRRRKIKANFMVPYGPNCIVLDYLQYDENVNLASIDRLVTRLWPQEVSRNKLACINVVTGYADWNVTLDGHHLTFPLTFGMYIRPRHQGVATSYMVHGDNLYSFTSPDRRHPFLQQPGDRKVFLTVRDCKTGGIIAQQEIKKIAEGISDLYSQPEHTFISPNGKYIVMSVARVLWVCDAQTFEFIDKIELPWLQYSIVGSRYDLEFSEDGSRLYLTEECNGHDFNVVELDCENRFKPVFIRSYHAPTRSTFVNRTSFNHTLQVQMLATRSLHQPMTGEWRPEMVKFVPLDELMVGVPRDLWAAEWKSKLPNPYPHDKWTWPGPNGLIQQTNRTAMVTHLMHISGVPAAAVHLHSLGMSTAQLFGAGAAVSANSGSGSGSSNDMTPRSKMLLQTPRRDYVMVSKEAITLPPLTKVQPNALQDNIEEPSSAPQEEYRSGVYYSGPPPKRKGKKTGAVRRSNEQGGYVKMDERREWWISGRTTPFKIINGERFLMFDQEETVYCCDFGPVGW